jgi:hypothetical protein
VREGQALPEAGIGAGDEGEGDRALAGGIIEGRAEGLFIYHLGPPAEGERALPGPTHQVAACGSGGIGGQIGEDEGGEAGSTTGQGAGPAAGIQEAEGAEVVCFPAAILAGLVGNPRAGGLHQIDEGQLH